MIKKFSVAASLVFAFVLSMYSNPGELYRQANEAYKKAAYDSAIVLYNKILDSVEAPEIYFNLGNAYFKTKDIPKAILNFERAHQRAPHDEDISFNLQLAQTLVVDKINVLPEFFLSQWWKGLGNLLSSNSWALLSMVFFVIVLASLLVYLFSKLIIVKKVFFGLACFFVMLSFIAFAQSYRIKHNVLDQTTAIVMSSTVNIKSSPDEKGTDIFVLHEGTKVWLLDEVGDWLKVKIADGNSGWIKKRHIEKI